MQVAEELLGERSYRKGEREMHLVGGKLANLDIVHFAHNVSCGFGRVRIKTLGCNLKKWIERENENTQVSPGWED